LTIFKISTSYYNLFLQLIILASLRRQEDSPVCFRSLFLHLALCAWLCSDPWCIIFYQQLMSFPYGSLIWCEEVFCQSPILGELVKLSVMIISQLLLLYFPRNPLRHNCQRWPGCSEALTQLGNHYLAQVGRIYLRLFRCRERPTDLAFKVRR